jgi:hypothetical protein
VTVIVPVAPTAVQVIVRPLTVMLELFEVIELPVQVAALPEASLHDDTVIVCPTLTVRFPPEGVMTNDGVPVLPVPVPLVPVLSIATALDGAVTVTCVFHALMRALAQTAPSTHTQLRVIRSPLRLARADDEEQVKGRFRPRLIIKDVWCQRFLLPSAAAP